ncbi:MAG: ferritin family protein [Gammaproteobacteria bacterium]|nr:ferritin family protein [Gammaproteobacteria bacterium]
MIHPEKIEDVAVFLALAYLLEIESAERYTELADNMQLHHLVELEQLFRQLSDYGDKHAEEVITYAGGAALPTLGTLDFQWEGPEGPETAGIDLISYEMSVEQALQVALHNEVRGRDFYANVAEKSPSNEVRKLANEFAQEENEHVHLLLERIEQVTDSEKQMHDDLDPPNMPE